MDTTIIISIIIFLGVVGVLAYVRMKSANNFEIKNSEIALALIPIVLFLLLTGKIQKFEFGDLKIETAFVAASQAAISSQVTILKGLPVETLRWDEKAGVGQIPQLVRRQTEALVFRLGHGGYYGPAIQEYLLELTKYPFFKSLIFNNNDGSLFGIADAVEVTAAIKNYEGPFNAADFARWLNESNQVEIEKIPSFVSAEYALNQDSDKKNALELMEKLDLEILPVVDSSGKFSGVVDRSRLTASLILDVTNQLEGEK